MDRPRHVQDPPRGERRPHPTSIDYQERRKRIKLLPPSPPPELNPFNAPTINALEGMFGRVLALANAAKPGAHQLKPQVQDTIAQSLPANNRHHDSGFRSGSLVNHKEVQHPPRRPLSSWSNLLSSDAHGRHRPAATASSPYRHLLPPVDATLENGPRVSSTPLVTKDSLHAPPTSTPAPQPSVPAPPHVPQPAEVYLDEESEAESAGSVVQLLSSEDEEEAAEVEAEDLEEYDDVDDEEVYDEEVYDEVDDEDVYDGADDGQVYDEDEEDVKGDFDEDEEEGDEVYIHDHDELDSTPLQSQDTEQMEPMRTLLHPTYDSDEDEQDLEEDVVEEESAQEEEEEIGLGAAEILRRRQNQQNRLMRGQGSAGRPSMGGRVERSVLAHDDDEADEIEDEDEVDQGEEEDKAEWEDEVDAEEEKDWASQSTANASTVLSGAQFHAPSIHHPQGQVHSPYSTSNHPFSDDVVQLLDSDDDDEELIARESSVADMDEESEADLGDRYKDGHHERTKPFTYVQEARESSPGDEDEEGYMDVNDDQENDGLSGPIDEEERFESDGIYQEDDRESLEQEQEEEDEDVQIYARDQEVVVLPSSDLGTEDDIVDGVEEDDIVDEGEEDDVVDEGEEDDAVEVGEEEIEESQEELMDQRSRFVTETEDMEESARPVDQDSNGSTGTTAAWPSISYSAQLERILQSHVEGNEVDQLDKSSKGLVAEEYDTQMSSTEGVDRQVLTDPTFLLAATSHEGFNQADRNMTVEEESRDIYTLPSRPHNIDATMAEEGHVLMPLKPAEDLVALNQLVEASMVSSAEPQTVALETDVMNIEKQSEFHRGRELDPVPGSLTTDRGEEEVLIQERAIAAPQTSGEMEETAVRTPVATQAEELESSLPRRTRLARMGTMARTVQEGKAFIAHEEGMSQRVASKAVSADSTPALNTTASMPVRATTLSPVSQRTASGTHTKRRGTEVDLLVMEARAFCSLRPASPFVDGADQDPSKTNLLTTSLTTAGHGSSPSRPGFARRRISLGQENVVEAQAIPNPFLSDAPPSVSGIVDAALFQEPPSSASVPVRRKGGVVDLAAENVIQSTVVGNHALRAFINPPSSPARSSSSAAASSRSNSLEPLVSPGGPLGAPTVPLSFTGLGMGSPPGGPLASSSTAAAGSPFSFDQRPFGVPSSAGSMHVGFGFGNSGVGFASSGTLPVTVPRQAHHPTPSAVATKTSPRKSKLAAAMTRGDLAMATPPLPLQLQAEGGAKEDARVKVNDQTMSVPEEKKVVNQRRDTIEEPTPGPDQESQDEADEEEEEEEEVEAGHEPMNITLVEGSGIGSSKIKAKKKRTPARNRLKNMARRAAIKKLKEARSGSSSPASPATPTI